MFQQYYEDDFGKAVPHLFPEINFNLNLYDKLYEYKK